MPFFHSNLASGLVHANPLSGSHRPPRFTLASEEAEESILPSEPRDPHLAFHIEAMRAWLAQSER